MTKFGKSARLSLILLAVIALLIFLNLLGLLAPVEALMVNIFSPIQSRIYGFGVGINNVYSGLAGSKSVGQGKQELIDQVNKLTVTNAQLNVKLAENTELLKQCGSLSKLNLTTVAARIIGKNPEPNLQSIILDRGSNDGVQTGSAIVAADGVLVGKIMSVKANSSEAVLTDDSRSRVAAAIQNASNSKGVISGELGLSLKMELIPQNESVSVGDLVVTSGLESNIPAGLVIGRVSRLVAESNSFFQTAYVQPIVKLDNLIIVSIIKGQSL